MIIRKFKALSSTHSSLMEYINKYNYTEPICFFTNNQTNGKGSRNNVWIGKNGNIFFSFVLHQDNLPNDLPIYSASIYFSFLLKKVLSKKKSRVYIKWPNDFYIDNKKIGGTITNITNNLLFCGIGINILNVSEKFDILDIDIKIDDILNEYFEYLRISPLWKQIISEFEVEFDHKKEHFSALKNGKLNQDGSLMIDDKRILSLR